jgi:type III secretory pathway component EscV
MIDNLTPSIEKPKKVKMAIRLLILSMIISFVSGYLKGLNKPVDQHAVVTDFPIQLLISTLLILSIIISITWFILHNVNAGKNWARIICSFVVSFGASYFIHILLL